jgi:hypothetical protein
VCLARRRAAHEDFQGEASSCRILVVPKTSVDRPAGAHSTAGDFIEALDAGGGFEEAWAAETPVVFILVGSVVKNYCCNRLRIHR